MEIDPRVQLFISHAHEETKLALILKAHIIGDFLGLVSVFVSADRQDLPAGADWPVVLKEEILKANVHAVLCSDRSLKHRWVNIELGGAWCRPEKQPVIIPLCHSGIYATALEPPLIEKQAITISEVDGLRSLYQLLADEIRCLLPSTNFEAIVREVQLFEEEYKISTSRQQVSERLLASGDRTIGKTIKNPAVLCISSRQREIEAKAAFELIRQALPVNLYHEVVVTYEDLSRELGTKHYDIIHTALYICPLSGDLVFGDIDPATRAISSVGKPSMTVEEFAKLIDVAGTSLLVVTTPEPFGLVGRLLPHTSIVFPSGVVEPPAMAQWMGAFYDLLAKSYSVSEACSRASARYCSYMTPYPQLPANSYMAYPSDPQPLAAMATPATGS